MLNNTKLVQGFKNNGSKMMQFGLAHGGEEMVGEMISEGDQADERF